MEEDKVGLKLTDDIMKSFSSAKVETDYKTPINSIDFNDDGTKIVVSDATSIRFYCSKTARLLKQLFNKVNRIRVCRFTHNDNAVIIATDCKPY